MPSVYEIYTYWQEEYGLTAWRGGKQRRKQNGVHCFACTWQGRLERAHILAKCDGGSDDVSNIHLLCRSCHVMQEGICTTEQGRQNWLKALKDGTPFLRAKLLYALAAAEILGTDEL